jgi:two-component system LytT family response regulator
MQTLLNSNLKADAMLLTVTKGIEVIDISTIVRIEASSSYSRIYFVNGQKLVSAKVLRWFEEKLPSHLFVRIHRTHLVNKKFISRYVNGSGGAIGLSNGEWIGVSKRKKADFLRNWYGTAA